MTKKRIAAAAAAALPGTVQPLLIAANRATAGLAEHTVAAGGHTVHYLAGGTGEPLVLLHGIFAEKEHWVDFARPLTGDWRVIAPDLPGFGESGRHADARYDYAAQVERLRAFLDALGLQRVHLAGNSMGGTLAALFAVAHPERVASVGFIGAPHGIRAPRPSAMDLAIEAGRAPLVARTAQEFDAMLSLVFAQRPFLPYPVLHATREAAMGQADSNLRVWQEQLADRWLLDARIAALQAPVLVLWGEADRVFDASGAQALQAKLPQARVAVLPGAGHLPMMEAPRPTAAAYDAFLRGLRPARPTGSSASPG